MARKPDYRDFYNLITVFIALILSTTKFLIEVNKHGLWKECILSVGFVGGFNYFLYYLGDIKVLSFSVFWWSCLVSFIAFCVYWSHLFNSSPYRQFSQNQLKRNSSYWAEHSWWWNLDGWQFEQEVAKIFILNGYKATVTKGSGDGGVDIIIEQDGYRAIVQCKHYRNPVSPEPIRALWGCREDFQANEVILVASSGITQSGADFISNKPNFRILNLDDIIRMSMQVQFQNSMQENLTKQSNNLKVHSQRGRKLDI